VGVSLFLTTTDYKFKLNGQTAITKNIRIQLHLKILINLYCKQQFCLTPLRQEYLTSLTETHTFYQRFYFSGEHYNSRSTKQFKQCSVKKRRLLKMESIRKSSNQWTKILHQNNLSLPRSSPHPSRAIDAISHLQQHQRQFLMGAREIKFQISQELCKHG